MITEGTAEVHVKHILTKLGLKSRVQMAFGPLNAASYPAGVLGAASRRDETG